jgi:hypothetical protein
LGNWRGNNTLYTYSISTSNLIAGTNTIDITCASGSGSAGQWLSPWHIYDAVDLVPTSSITNAPVVSSITVTPANPTLAANSQQAFVATARDQFSNVTPANFTWSAVSGAVDGTGAYTAPVLDGSDTVTAAASGTAVSGNTTISVFIPPTVVGGLTYGYQTLANTLSFTFSESVQTSLGSNDLFVARIDTNGNVLETIPVSLSNYDSGTNTATFALNGGAMLSDGNYRVTLNSSDITDNASHALTGTNQFDFYFYRGDLNGDRRVDALDIYVMSSNWLATGATYSMGDFNYDSTVDSSDLSLLANNWLQTLPAPAPALAPPLIVPTAVLTSTPSAPSAPAAVDLPAATPTIDTSGIKPQRPVRPATPFIRPAARPKIPPTPPPSLTRPVRKTSWLTGLLSG